MSAAVDLARRRVRRATPPTCRCGASWRAPRGGPVLDVGAGTGRVALDLAARRPRVTALDRRPASCWRRWRERAAARGLAVDDRRRRRRRRSTLGDGAFALVAVPMQTIQLLAGPRPAVLRAPRAARLAPGGLLALAIADELEPLRASRRSCRRPTSREVDGWRYVSQPTAVRRARRRGADRAPARTTIAPDGDARAETDVDRCSPPSTPPTLEREGAAAGLRPRAGAATSTPTDDHVGSEVVMLRG